MHPKISLDVRKDEIVLSSLETYNLIRLPMTRIRYKFNLYLILVHNLPSLELIKLAKKKNTFIQL